MLVAMAIGAAFCIGIGLMPGRLYALLPYPVAYQPYSVSHVLAQLQLLLFAGLVFAAVIAGDSFLWRCPASISTLSAAARSRRVRGQNGRTHSRDRRLPSWRLVVVQAFFVGRADRPASPPGRVVVALVADWRNVAVGHADALRLSGALPRRVTALAASRLLRVPSSAVLESASPGSPSR